MRAAQLRLKPGNLVATRITVEGADELHAALAGLEAKLVKAILRPAVAAAMRVAAKAIRAKLRANLARRRKAKDRTGELMKSIGSKVLTHHNMPMVTGKAGPMQTKGSGAKQEERDGGYYGWLVEFGHRIVHGGTVRRLDGGRAGISAAGKAWLAEHGMVAVRGRLLHPKRGRTETIKKILWEYQGVRAYPGIGAPGKRFDLRERNAFLGRQIRGGGRVSRSAVPGYPFVGPAAASVQGEMAAVLKGRLAQEIEKQTERLRRKAA
jgi:hypothetical protein